MFFQTVVNMSRNNWQSKVYGPVLQYLEAVGDIYSYFGAPSDVCWSQTARKQIEEVHCISGTFLGTPAISSDKDDKLRKTSRNWKVLKISVSFT